MLGALASQGWRTYVASVRLMEGRDPLACPAALVAGHTPFCRGASAADAALASQTLAINPDAVPICDALRDKHHLRKHGAEAYYGQPKGKV